MEMILSFANEQPVSFCSWQGLTFTRRFLANVQVLLISFTNSWNFDFCMCFLLNVYQGPKRSQNNIHIFLTRSYHLLLEKVSLQAHSETNETIPRVSHLQDRFSHCGLSFCHQLLPSS